MAQEWSVVDLFSGAGGMSCGFHRHASFAVLAAADAQIGKPSARPGSLGCNDSYRANIGTAPVPADLAVADPADVCQAMGLGTAGPTVLTACPPCTGFSRVKAVNHRHDDQRNSLVGRVADYAALLQPQIVVVENARELVTGRFARHLHDLAGRLERQGYQVAARTHLLTAFGLPQRRERAIVIAARRPLVLRDLTQLWAGWRVEEKATHVRRAIWDMPPVRAGESHPADPMHVSPAVRSVANQRRLSATPGDGGGWADLISHPDSGVLLTPAMQGRVSRGDLGSHPDIYGRLYWDRPAVTIKRECGHIGNGRYAHPEQDRLCTVRELSILQGFPRDYCLTGSLANMYRHVGDAVPPLISYQLASLCRWILSGERPAPSELIMPGCHLTPQDLQKT